MSFDFHVHPLDTEREISRAVNFLRLQDLGYKGYHDWVDKAKSQLMDGSKRCVAAYDGDELVAEVVYQPHRSLNRVTEMKNLRIQQGYRLRGLAYFLVRQVEVESQSDGSNGVVCDVRSNQREVLGFLRSMGYMPILERQLYDSENLDVVFSKAFTERTESGIIHSVRNLLS